LRRALVPLGWGLGIGCGVLVGALVGPYLPGWGVALAPAGAVIVFSIGAVRVPEDEALGWVLRLTVVLTLGFLVASVPVTEAQITRRPEALVAMQDVLATRTTAEAHFQLRAMWAVMAAAVPIGALSLALRHGRRRAG